MDMFLNFDIFDDKLLDSRIIYDTGNKYYEKYDNVVLTCYMTSKKDPQRNIYMENNNYDYIKPWYESMLKCDLHGIIFYDLLSDDFIDKYQTDKIIFIKCKMGCYSINDERFIIYYKYLLKNKYKNVLMTDVSDVIITANPFNLINNSVKLFVGTNVVGCGAKKRTPEWFARRKWKIDPFNKKLKTKKYDDVGYVSNTIQIYSAGLLGGDYLKIMWFLNKMSNIFFIVHSEKNNNMIIFNYIINKFLLEEYNEKTFCTKYIHTGYPFNSLFGKNQVESGCYLIHK